MRKQKQLRREMNAPGGAKGRAQKLLGLKRSGGGGGGGGASSDTKKDKRAIGGDSREIDVGAVFDRVFNGGTVDKTTGATTLEMGVQCIDIVTGAAGSMTASARVLRSRVAAVMPTTGRSRRCVSQYLRILHGTSPYRVRRRRTAPALGHR